MGGQRILNERVGPAAVISLNRPKPPPFSGFHGRGRGMGSRRNGETENRRIEETRRTQELRDSRDSTDEGMEQLAARSRQLAAIWSICQVVD